MINCQVCEHNPTGERCEYFGRVIGMHGCSSGVERKPRKNFEMVKNMSMEQMAEWLDAISKAWYDEGYTKETDEPLMSPYPATASKWLEWLMEEI